ncbi:MAG: hypothetical protein ACRD5H_15860 [Nitrososphaerales archaeon]
MKTKFERAKSKFVEETKSVFTSDKKFVVNCELYSNIGLVRTGRRRHDF